MMRLVGYLITLAVLNSACTRTTYVYQSVPRHDNGLHKGWYKQGKVKALPPGQAKKMGRW
jgi:hypothetical protein